MTSTEKNEGPAAPIVVDLDEEHDRYHRQNLISWWDQERLAAATVLVVGAGALGNELVKNLALIGVGRIIVADMDSIENSNLSRCVFFRPGDDGRLKAEVLAERAAALNPDVEIIPVVGDIRLAVGLAVFDEVDVVLGGLDNREARLFVNQACWKTTTPWVDGAIEGLMGVARVFIPPASACYECTLGERDYELMAARKSCALLSHDEMAGGRVPTTATSGSVVAAIQVQEAVKLLHEDRLDAADFAGRGFQFVGLTHDSYVVQYSRDENCLSHDTYDLESAEGVDPATPIGDLLESVADQLGAGAVIDFEHEIAVAGHCGACGAEEPINRPVDSLSAGAGLCSQCGEPWRLEFAHSVETGSSLAQLSPTELGIPPADVLTGRVGMERRFYKLTTVGKSAIESLLDAQQAAPKTATVEP